MITHIFAGSQLLAYISVEYNLMYGNRYVKSYTEQKRLCSSFLRILRVFPELNRALLREVVHTYTLYVYTQPDKLSVFILNSQSTPY